MKFKEGDRIKIVHINENDIVDENDSLLSLIGKTGVIDEANEDSFYPYGILYDDDELSDKTKVEQFFPRFFMEDELELVEDEISKEMNEYNN